METPLAFHPAAMTWRERTDATRDFSLIRNNSAYKAGLARRSWIFEDEFFRAETLLIDLMTQYGEVTLEDATGGEEIRSSEGPCLLIESHHPLTLHRPSPPDVMARLYADLTLVHGIGARKASALARKGVLNLRHLLANRRYRAAASVCLEVLAGGDRGEIASLIARRHPASDHAVLLTSALFREDEVLFLDIETLGLFSRPIFLVGLGSISQGNLIVRQYLTRDVSEEPAVLDHTLSALREGGVLMTYNGKSFDIPCLIARAGYYAASVSAPHPHIDLLHHARRSLRDLHMDCRLGTVEREVMGVARQGDVPGCMVPEFYEAFLKTGNPGPLTAVIYHNRQDIVSLALLYAYLFRGGT
ncbi:MAG: ribonuclease H-like domain-containing protein [Methanomicrobiales archaeon]|nr:ribonuclease H-like domain-containing protein [Methanomicrobiales archaeon]